MLDLNLYEFSVQLLGELPPQFQFFYAIFTFIIACALIGIFIYIFKFTSYLLGGRY